MDCYYFSRCPNIRRFYYLFFKIIYISTLYLLFFCAVFFRFWKLDSIPGINGDEAWTGVNVLQFINDRSIVWITPSHKLINPFYFFLQVVLQSPFPPFFILLRIGALISGLSAITFNYFFCKRIFDKFTATISTFILAVLPINIAYSRIGWDPSQSLLGTLFVLYMSLFVIRDIKNSIKWMVFGILAYIAVFIIHPTNIFIAPFLLIAIYIRWHKELKHFLNINKPTILRFHISFIFLIVAITICYLMRNFLAISLGRLFCLADIFLFFINYIRMFSGITVYRYMAGSCYWRPLPIGNVLLDIGVWDYISVFLFIVAIYFLHIQNRPNKNIFSPVAFLSLALPVSLIIFYLIAGPKNINPHVERYGLWFIAPSVLLLANSIAIAKNTISGCSKNFIFSGIIIVGLTMLFSFYFNYFRFFERTGGLSHNTYRTAIIEPKLSVLNYILNHRHSKNEKTWIVALEYWNYWPIKYLAYNMPEIKVLDLTEFQCEMRRDYELTSAIKEGRCWFVGFDDSAELVNVRQFFIANKIPYKNDIIGDYANRPLLTMVHSDL